MKKKYYLLLVALATLATTTQAQIISTVAGSGTLAGYSGDSGPATSARLNSPGASVIDAAGNIYIADKNNHVIRKVTSSGGIVTIVGDGTAGLIGDGGAANVARISSPLSVAVDGLGNLYIADFGNSRIRKVTAGGIISTVAGSTPGYLGDGGVATAAHLSSPTDVAVDAAGNIYICDYGNSRIRMVNTSGIITTIAGTGFAGYSGDGTAATGAQLSNPNGVCVDKNGNVYIADNGNSRVRKIDVSGIITTIGGSGSASYTGDGGAATAAGMSNPVFVAVDDAGNVFVNDNYWACTRRIAVSGNIVTVAGGNGYGYTGDGGAATAAQLDHPTGVTFDAANNMYITEQSNHTVRKVAAIPITLGGAASVCVGATTTLSTTVSDDGVWLSSNTATATVDPLTGIVTGVSSGSVTISFSMGMALGTITMTVNPLPAPIVGATTLCVGASTTMSDATPGGTWTCGGGATIDPLTGVITGVSAAVPGIAYHLPTGCRSVTTMTITPLPNAGAISGVNTECIGGGNMLGNTATGGVWSSSNTAVATVSATGTVNGLSAGTTTISYTVTNSCGSASATFPFTVDPCHVGVDNQEVTDNGISVFPNPVASGRFSITLPLNTSLPARLILTNSVGQTVKEMQVTNSQVTMDVHMPAGVYILSVIAGNRQYRTKISIN